MFDFLATQRPVLVALFGCGDGLVRGVAEQIFASLGFRAKLDAFRCKEFVTNPLLLRL